MNGKVKDYYEVLGVSKNATSDDIAKSYRRLARKHHPDTNPKDKAASTKKFKEVSEAYNVLSDSDKRREYDMFGPAGPPSGRASAGSFFDLDSIFKHFARHPENRMGDIHLELGIEFKEAVLGCKKTFPITRETNCDTCDGKGALKWDACGSCHGNGHRQVTNGPFLINMTCNVCGGTGKEPVENCSDCNGTGYQKNTIDDFNIEIPPGVDNDTILKVIGQGHVGKGGNSDLLIKISVKDDDLFSRDGVDLIVRIPFTYSQLVLGCEKDIPTISGTITIKIKPGTQPGERIRLSGLGVRNMRTGKIGCLQAIVDLEVPKNISKDYKKEIESIMGLEEKQSLPTHQSYLENVSNR